MVDNAYQSFGHPVRRVVSPSQSTGNSSCQSSRNSDCPPSGRVLICGQRREMEDTATIAPSFIQLHHGTTASCLCKVSVQGRPSCDQHFFAVYDGHGGSQASKYCMERLHHALAEELSSLSRAREGVNETSEGPTSFSTWKKAMVSCFSKIDAEVRGMCLDGQCGGDLERVVAPGNVGTSAVVSVVSSCEIVVANCGSSRAVLSRGGKTIPLATDHKPERGDEANHIEAAGGRVVYWDGYRVGGLLRSIGDRCLEEHVVLEPEVTCLERTKEDECVILASDSLWDVVSNDTAGEIARRCLASSRKKRAMGSFLFGEDPASAAAAALLVKLAYGRGSKDNISVVVIDLEL